MINAQCLICHSAVPNEGAEEGSGMVQAATQRLLKISPPLGGHFRIHLSNTVIPGKGQMGDGAAFLIYSFRGIPRQATSCEIVRQGDNLNDILFIFQGLKMILLNKELDSNSNISLLIYSQTFSFIDV